jgi:hypothetical protein
MEVILTFEIFTENFTKQELFSLESISMAELLRKNEFNYLTDDYSIRLKYLAKEIFEKKTKVIVFGNPCYSIEDLKILSVELEKFELKISLIYLPKEIHIQTRQKNALLQNSKFGSHFGNTEHEIKRAFEEIRLKILEFEKYCIENNINYIFR